MKPEKSILIYILPSFFLFELTVTFNEVNIFKSKIGNVSEEIEDFKIFFQEAIKNSVGATLKEIIVLSSESTHEKSELFTRKFESLMIRLNWNQSPLIPLCYENQIVVIFLDEIETVTKAVSLKIPFWNHGTKFFIVSDFFKENTRKIDLFGVFWNMRVKDVILLESEKGFYGYGFTPYQKGFCNKPFPLLMVQWESNKTVYHRKLTTERYDMNGCELMVSYMDIPPFVISKNVSLHRHHLGGIEGHLIKTVAKKLNFKPIYKSRHEIEWGVFFPPTGLLGDVYTGSSEFGFGLLFSFHDRYIHLDVSAPHNVDECVGWVVPKGAGETKPLWIRIFFEEFSNVLWIAISLTFIFICFVFSYLRVPNFDVRASFLLDIYSSFLSLPIRESNLNRFRSFALCWLWFSYIITTSYRTSLSSRLTAPNLSSDIRTMQELSISKIHLTGPGNALAIVKMAAENELGNVQKTITSRFQIKNYTVTEVLERIRLYRDVGFVKHVSHFEYMALTQKKYRGKIHVVEECFYQYYPWILLKKKSPVTWFLNRIISQLNEGGILQKWKNDVLPPIKETKSGEMRKLVFGDLKALFLFLVISWIFSFGAFLGEILYPKILLRRLKNSGESNRYLSDEIPACTNSRTSSGTIEYSETNSRTNEQMEEN